MALGSFDSPKEILSSISKLVLDESELRTFSSLTPCIYDTAWLSMVPARSGGQDAWLFPDLFDTILRSQQRDGTWESYSSRVDGILNTLASLLALLTHANTTPVNPWEPPLSQRIHKAHSGLTGLLEDWSVGDTVHVGFEVLVPSLLRQVQKYAIHFEFDGYKELLDLHDSKMKHFKPELLYSKQPGTLLHSLDFDQVSHHCSKEVGIFGSPAATAAYLLNRSTWDDKAESYLSNVVATFGSGNGVPSAFPTYLFETTWVSLIPCCGFSLLPLEMSSVRSTI